ncbi:sporulation protein [Pseudonocardia lacus]|uniref:sporulation protein n=1 Tax=Pseudonocardia lacus TaxID=2835865 RepID=UPI002028590D|nr:sporulation protein [Pseudonocardia lacus]
MDTTMHSRNARPSPAAGAPAPDVGTLLDGVEAAARANRVFGEPIDAHGVTIVTAARVGGGGGAGSGTGPGEEGGSGGGFGGRPVGAFVLSQGTARWQPAVDVNRLVLVVAAVAVLALLTARRVARLQAAGCRSER